MKVLHILHCLAALPVTRRDNLRWNLVLTSGQVRGSSPALLAIANILISHLPPVSIYLVFIAYSGEGHV